jgi:hypothetical protein
MEDANGIPWWTSARVRLALLLTGLGLLVFYLLAVQGGVSGLGASTGQAPTTGAWAAGCPARDAPPVARVAPGYIAALRAEVGSVMRGRRGRLYEAGTVTSENAWSDNVPRPDEYSLPRAASVPGAYELRWWAPNGDDIAADAFVFARAGQAHDFFERATSARCRRMGTQLSTASPLNARDLVWLNPDNVVQDDVYLLRGHRVYRVVDVRRRQESTSRGDGQQLAFFIVNGLACALPGAGCQPSRLWLGAPS